MAGPGWRLFGPFRREYMRRCPVWWPKLEGVEGIYGGDGLLLGEEGVGWMELALSGEGTNKQTNKQ